MNKHLFFGLIVLAFLTLALTGCGGPTLAQAQEQPKTFEQITNDNLNKVADEISKNPPDYTATFNKMPWMYELSKATVAYEIKWVNGKDLCGFSGTGLVVRNSKGRMVILTARHVLAKPGPEDNCKGTFTDWSKIVMAPSFSTLSRGGIVTFDRSRVIVEGPSNADWTFIGIKLTQANGESIPAWHEYPAVHFGVTPTVESLHAMVFQTAFEMAGAQIGQPTDFIVQPGRNESVSVHSSDYSSGVVNVDKPVFPGSSGTAFADDTGTVEAVGVEIALNENDGQSEYSAVQYLTGEGVELFRKLETELEKIK